MTIPIEWTRLRPPGRCLSDLALDQLAAGQAPGALAAEAWRAHLRQCAACEGRRHDLDVDAHLEFAPRGEIRRRHCSFLHSIQLVPRPAVEWSVRR